MNFTESQWRVPDDDEETSSEDKMVPLQLEQPGTLHGRSRNVMDTTVRKTARTQCIARSGGPTGFIISKIEREEDVYLELFDQKILEDIVKLTAA